MNEDFFNKCAVEESSYFLGFLMADGCVTEGTIRLDLQYRDVHILRELKRAIGGGNIYVRERKSDGRKYAVFIVRSDVLISDLANWGVVRRKCFSAKAPVGLSVEVQRHFWRGMIDGDGSIFIGERGTEFNLELAGTKSVCQSFGEFLKRNGIPHKRRVVKFRIIGHHTSDHFAFRLKAKLARSAIELLYADANVALNRKKLLANRASSYRYNGLSVESRKRLSDYLKVRWKIDRDKMLCGIARGWDNADDRRRGVAERFKLYRGSVQ